MSARPTTTQGRLVRIGTQSLLSASDKFIDPENTNFKKYAQKPTLGKALCDFLLYSEHNPRRALDLCSQATQTAQLKI